MPGGHKLPGGNDGPIISLPGGTSQRIIRIPGGGRSNCTHCGRPTQFCACGGRK